MAPATIAHTGTNAIMEPLIKAHSEATSNQLKVEVERLVFSIEHVLIKHKPEQTKISYDVFSFYLMS